MHWREWQIKIKELEQKYLPKKLYYRGEWNEGIFDNVLAIVGSRKMTRYGKEVVDKFVPELVAQGVTIISGFMYGVDVAAHQKCLEYGGKTIAVLGGGLDHLFPLENDQLYTDILGNGGLVISEYEPNFVPTLWTFPQRNRIVAALANKGVLVVEAGLKSGSLITARLAEKYGQKVWATPGSIFSGVSQGTNWLISEKKAKIAVSPEQVLEIKTETEQFNLFEDNLNEVELKIVRLLSDEDLSVDEIGRKLKKSISEIAITVSGLSLKGLISEEMGRLYLTK